MSQSTQSRVDLRTAINETMEFALSIDDNLTRLSQRFESLKIRKSPDPSDEEFQKAVASVITYTNPYVADAVTNVINRALLADTEEFRSTFSTLRTSVYARVLRLAEDYYKSQEFVSAVETAVQRAFPTFVPKTEPQSDDERETYTSNIVQASELMETEIDNPDSNQYISLKETYMPRFMALYEANKHAYTYEFHQLTDLHVSEIKKAIDDDVVHSLYIFFERMQNDVRLRVENNNGDLSVLSDEEKLAYDTDIEKLRSDNVLRRWFCAFLGKPTPTNLVGVASCDPSERILSRQEKISAEKIKRLLYSLYNQIDLLVFTAMFVALPRSLMLQVVTYTGGYNTDYRDVLKRKTEEKKGKKKKKRQMLIE